MAVLEGGAVSHERVTPVSTVVTADPAIENAKITKRYRGTSPITPPRTLNIGLRQGPGGGRFIMSEVPLTP